MRRSVLFGVLVLGCLLVATLGVVAGVPAGDPATRGAAGGEVLLRAREDGRSLVLFRSTQSGGGQVAVAPLGGSPGRRTAVPLRCDRVHVAGGRGLCLTRGSGFADGYEARVLGAGLRVRHALDVAGVPSRARVSPDGRLGSVTLFVTGHSYAAEGAFSTRTTLIDLASGRSIAELEDFVVTRAGRRVTAVDVNFWGVTFARDSDRFYATMATGGSTYLVRGSVRGRVASTIHENVECPSLSPDGTRIAYKRRTGSDFTPWRLTVLDLNTMRETPLAETRSVDDQAEWLDDGHVLYGIAGGISVVAADGTGRPRPFIGAAGSPAVLRG